MSQTSGAAGGGIVTAALLVIGDEYVTVVKVSCWKLQLENTSGA